MKWRRRWHQRVAKRVREIEGVVAKLLGGMLRSNTEDSVRAFVRRSLAANETRDHFGVRLTHPEKKALTGFFERKLRAHAVRVRGVGTAF